MNQSNDDHNLIKITDPLTHETKYSYNEEGHPTSITDPLDHILGDVEYNQYGGPTTLSTIQGGNASVQYDPVTFMPLSASDNLGFLGGYTWTTQGNPETYTNQYGETTGYTYTAQGYVEVITDPLLHKTHHAYDEFGRVTDVTTARLFAEVLADPDRPDVRPQEAYQAILSSMQPGWTLRLLQLFWPDPEPRLEFQKQVSQWKRPNPEGLDILHQGLLLAVQEYSLPFVRRTVLEFVLSGDEGIAWWEGLVGLCASFGLRIRHLDQAAIEALTRWVLNPNVEYKDA